ncbi:MAG: topoisomerase IV [Oscillospiraceae bacterium]|nr:topoisomerase IV [Oscillospiraceae bacterium]
MARKSTPKEDKNKINRNDPSVMGLHAEVLEQGITETLESNYMPYAMSVIVSRAIPEIDGFKPAHRKLLYTMYKMGLLNGGRTKSANIVGATMRLNPHGDAAIYDTMVRLSRGNGALLHPFVDSKGNFGKCYSRDMACAASRYTEAKLDGICSEIFRDIDHDTVDFVDNYDSTMKEPTLLPTTFPNILVSANMGIAVGMASQICGFNLGEVCRTAAALLENPDHDILSTLTAPDFSTGGEILFDEEEMRRIYETGRGGFRVRCRWRYDKSQNLIEIYEIPYTTTAEAIIDKVAELMKNGKVKEISDMRDETDLSGLKLTIDLKRGTDPEALMQKLCRLTPLTDTFSCNFNILIAGMPQVLGVRDIFTEWTAWRMECVRRRVFYVLSQKKDKLHLLEGLEKILLDIDKAIKIIRETDEEVMVVPNLMDGFGIDEIQAEYIADIKLRNINREYILKRTAEIARLREEIEDLEKTLSSRRRIRSIIAGELAAAEKKYGQPRKTGIVYEQIDAEPVKEEIPDYPVTVFVSGEGYFKKITPQSLRMSGAQKYKEGDELLLTAEASNKDEMLVFTDSCQVYKTRLNDFEDGKASALGDFLPSKLGMDEGEKFFRAVLPRDYEGCLLFVYENGKAAKVELSAYVTKTNRKKLVGAYSDKSPLADIVHLRGDREVVLYSTEGRALIINSADVAAKTTKNSQGVQVMKLKPKYKIEKAMLADDSPIQSRARYKTKTIPAAGAIVKGEDAEEKQLTLEE